MGYRTSFDTAVRGESELAGRQYDDLFSDLDQGGDEKEGKGKGFLKKFT
jgi:hypothetical protein